MEDERHFYDSLSEITSSINGRRTRVFRTPFLRLKLDSAASAASAASAVSAGGGAAAGAAAAAMLYVTC